MGCTCPLRAASAGLCVGIGNPPSLIAEYGWWGCGSAGPNGKTISFDGVLGSCPLLCRCCAGCIWVCCAYVGRGDFTGVAPSDDMSFSINACCFPCLLSTVSAGFVVATSTGGASGVSDPFRPCINFSKRACIAGSAFDSSARCRVSAPCLASFFSLATVNLLNRSSRTDGPPLTFAVIASCGGAPGGAGAPGERLTSTCSDSCLCAGSTWTTSSIASSVSLELPPCASITCLIHSFSGLSTGISVILHTIRAEPYVRNKRCNHEKLCWTRLRRPSPIPSRQIWQIKPLDCLSHLSVPYPPIIHAHSR